MPSINPERVAALTRGEKYYSTGRACKFGHLARRYTSTQKCVECNKDKLRVRYAKNPSKYLKSNSAWRTRNIENNKKTRAEYARRPEVRAKARAKGRAKRNFPEPLRPEPDHCECCGVHKTKQTRYTSLALDHDHETGKFRGWLCGRCNLALGMLGDTLLSVERARSYLLRSLTGIAL